MNRPFLLAALLALALGACNRPPAAATPPPPTVSVVKPVARKIVEQAEFTGRLAAVEYVEIRPRVSGYIVEIPFKEGQLVKKGEVLFVIDQRPYEATLGQAKGQLEVAQAQRELAVRNFTRAEELQKTQVSSREDFDTKLTARNQAEAALATARAAAASAQLNLDFTRILAPIDGRVSRPFVTVGNLVQADSTQLTNIVSVDPVYAYADLDERTVIALRRLIREGKITSARDTEKPLALALPGETGFPHRGVIDFVDNQIAAATGTLTIRGRFPNADGLLLPGMFVRVQLPVSPEYDGLLIPDRAVISDQGQKFVLVVGADGNVARKRVTLGQVDTGLRVVREGLAPEDQVIVEGLLKARPGAPAKPELVDPQRYATDQLASRPAGQPAAAPSPSPAASPSPTPASR